MTAFKPGRFRVNDRSLATGIVDPENELIFTVNASDPSKFDHTAGRIQICDAYSDPEGPTVKVIDVPARTGITVDNLATESATFVYLDVNGDIVQETILQGGAFLRDHVGCTILLHGDNATISDSTNFTPSNLLNTNLNNADMSYTIGNLNGTQGGRNIITGAAGSTKLNKDDGTFYYHSINSRFDSKSPNIRTSPQLIEPDFFIAWSTSDNPIGKFVETTTGIPAGIYDDGTAVFTDPLPKGTYGDEEWVNHRLFLAVDGDVFFMQFGTTVYPTAVAAQLGVATEDFTVIPSIQATVPIATITMRGGATDFSDPNDVDIRQAKSARAEFV